MLLRLLARQRAVTDATATEYVEWGEEIRASEHALNRLVVPWPPEAGEVRNRLGKVQTRTD